MTTLSLRYVALTDTGLRRTANQDSGYASSRLIAIADGMGGAAAGDLASAEVMNVVRQLDRELDGDPQELLEDAVFRANQRLGELISKNPSVEGMGTTLEAMVWDGKKLTVAHIGDSRAYRLRDRTLTQISTDHTFVQGLVDEGRISASEARVHPHRSLIVRAMLGRDDNDADYSVLQPVLGDRYLLCSDGLSDMVEDEVIAQALGADSIDLAATELVRLALEGGGHDNVTVVIGEFVDAELPTDDNLSCANGQPQLVGAAAGQPRPRTGNEVAPSSESVAVDPEELRYAPRPPGRMRWLKWSAAILVVAAILGAAGMYAYNWTQDQYFVAEADGKVAIYQGVQANIPGLDLNHVDEITDIELDTLPAFQRQTVLDGIEASSRADAEMTVADLETFVIQPEPAPQPNKKKQKKNANEATATVWSP